MFLGQFYLIENYYIELKEFCLKMDPSLILDYDEVKEILINGIWNYKLTSFIITNLNYYVKFYMPKYFTSFANSGINGQLMIGINDDGEITGIPSKIPITKLMVQKMINRNLNKYLTISESRCNKFIEKSISISVIKLDIDPQILDDYKLKKFVQDYQLKYQEYQIKYNEYLKIKKVWLSELNDNRSLNNVLNLPIPRKQFLEYMISINVDHEYDHIIAILKIDKILPIPDHYKLQKCKKNNLNLYYWLMKYKDDKNQEVYQRKPIKPSFNERVNFNTTLLQINKLNDHFINDKEIGFYLIIININGKLIPKGIKYKLPNSDKWLNKKRLIINGQPCCV